MLNLHISLECDRVAQIFQIYTSHLNTTGARKVTRSKPHTHNLQIFKRHCTKHIYLGDVGLVSCAPLDYGQRLQRELVSHVHRTCGSWPVLWTMWCHSYIKRVEICQSALCRLYRYWDYETQSDRKRETSKQSSQLCGSANSNIRLVHKRIPDFIRVFQLSLASFSVFHVLYQKHHRSVATLARKLASWIRSTFGARSRLLVRARHNTDTEHMNSIERRKGLKS